ncbi:glycosyltransferase family 20 [Colletotrichum abscissum]|uniref:Glycosyltransferase family 20 n=1 Tax=Colletotrichum abscissum TaxID=1671311 RepID=A0A9Q0B2F8_9PEZI|nr:glycosyltransferase family 20 [Colletotrichum abscissum]
MPSLVPDEETAPGRLLLLSNRLPITIKRSDDGSYSFSMSSGGLVTGLSGLSKTTSFQWYGWPGLEVPENEIAGMKQRLKDEYDAHPVFIDDELADKHYNGFSNSILWPLFHYHPGEITFDESAWAAYREVNRLFAKAVVQDVQDGDLIWVHDYHLMLLPEMLREEIGDSKKNVKIGFFLHTPFPSSEIYRILPVREALLTGVLDCDLIGFHTYDYARHFLSSCSRILGTPTTPNGVDYNGKFVTVGAFPIGIDPEKFVEGLKKPKVQERIDALTRKFNGYTSSWWGQSFVAEMTRLSQEATQSKTLKNIGGNVVGQVTKAIQGAVDSVTGSKDGAEDAKETKAVKQEA